MKKSVQGLAIYFFPSAKHLAGERRVQMVCRCVCNAKRRDCSARRNVLGLHARRQRLRLLFSCTLQENVTGCCMMPCKTGAKAAREKG